MVSMCGENACGLENPSTVIKVTKECICCSLAGWPLACTAECVTHSCREASYCVCIEGLYTNLAVAATTALWLFAFIIHTHPVIYYRLSVVKSLYMMGHIYSPSTNAIDVLYMCAEKI